MPTYEYRCKDCGAELEVVQAFTDDALTACESCGGALRKVFGNVGISFKGSGFYKNDSRGSKAGGSSGDSSSSGSDGGDTKKAEPATNGSSEKSTSDKKPEKKASDKSAAKPAPATSSSS